MHAGEEARAAYRFPTDRRGRYEVGPLRVTVADPFALVERTRFVLGTEEVIVYPRVRDVLPPPESGGLDLDREQPQVRSRIEPSGEFHTLRDYAPGDDLRHVHWRSTARRGHLMMRQNEARRRTPVLVLLDVRPGAHDRPSFERAVEACASIVTAIERSGRPVEVMLSTGRMIGTPGRRHLGTVMDELAVVEPHGPDRIVASESRHRSGALVAIIGQAQPTDAAALGVLVRDGGQLSVVECMPGAAPLSLRSRRLRRPMVVANGAERPLTDSWNEAVVRWQPHRASIAVNVTPAGLTVATAFALTRVFAGRSWLPLMVVAAIAPPLFLEWTRRRSAHPVVQLAIVGVVGLWLSALVADPATTVAGVPTRATIASLGHALGQAPHTLRAAVVPVAPTGSALVLAFVGVFVAAALTYWIATSLDAPIGVFAPSIALFIVVAAIGDGGWVAPTALYALASLGYLLALAQHDLAVRRTWFHTTRPRESRVAAGGIIVGAIAVAAALVVGPSVPGAGGSPLLDYRAIGRGDNEGSLLSAPPPILSIKDKLTLGPVQELFTVSSPRAAYWRVIALDWFTDENAWGVNKATELAASKLKAPLNLPPSTPVHQQFHIETLDPHWLPAAYQPVAINLTAARVVPDSLTLLVDSKSHLSDLVYDVDSEIPTPSLAVLQQAPQSDRRKMATDLELPADFPEAVRSLADTVTRGATTPYGRALALEKFFRSGAFTYTTNTNLGDSPDAITEFLTKTKAGFCEQFAASFAAMARAVGVPARVAVGYQSGTLGADGLYHVTNRNAHAWPEVWIEGAGWIPFEPTPGFSEPTLGIGTGGPAKAGGGTGPSTSTTVAGGPTTLATGPTPSVKAPNLSVQTPTPAAPAHHRGLNAVAIAGIAVAALAMVVLAIFLAIAFTIWRRRWRRRHEPDPRRRVLGAWAEALDELRSAGVPPRPSATALEFALRYAPAYGAGDAGPALMELAQLQSAAMYAREEPSAVEATSAWEHVDTIRATIRHNIARTRRWRRLARNRKT